MRWLKTVLFSVFIGFYFLSITPVHFYLHSDHNELNTQILDDCSFIHLLNFGQGNYFTPDAVEITAPKEVEFVQHQPIEKSVGLVPSVVSSYFNLRAPPRLNC